MNSDERDLARLKAVEAFIDHMATQQAEADRPGCPDPIECGHEAALGMAEMQIKQLTVRLGQYADCAAKLLAAIGRIAAAHSKDVGDGGLASGYCNECDHRAPCPTYIWATTDRDPLATWDPDDDEPDTPSTTTKETTT